MPEKQSQPNPLEGGKGRIDEVDQSKGVFPAGASHPPGAEPRTPGEMGGGSYDESGRGGVELPSGPVTPREPVVEPGHQTSANVGDEEPGGQEKPTEKLPPHERGKK